jgi:O-antigen/teichoic acid export membrane protein
VTLTHWKLEGPAMTFRTDRKELLAILSHSRWVAANSALTVMTSQADKVLIGYAFGFQVLGTYSIATSLFLTLTRLVSQIQAGVGLPVQRALLDQPPATRRRNYYRFRLPFDLYCLVVGVSMTLLGPLLFGLAYDERYQLSGVLFAFLGMKVALMPLLLAGSVLYADLRYKMMMAIGVVRSTVFLSAMAAAVYFHSIKFMVLAIALEKLPDIVLYFTVKKAGVFFDIKRDGIIIAIVAAQCAYLLTFH